MVQIYSKKLSLAALAARAHWPTVEWLPKYAPELNDIEGVWRHLRAHYLAHRTFADTDALDTAIHHAVYALNVERKPLPLVKPRISVRVLTRRDVGARNFGVAYNARDRLR